MDNGSIFSSIADTLAGTLPNMLSALAILIVGWVIAVLLRSATSKLLGLAKLDQRIQSTTDEKVNAESLISSGVYWLVILLALVAFFGVLNLAQVSDPLQALVTKFFDYAPNLIGGAVIALVAWIVAGLVRTLTIKALSATRLDQAIAGEGEARPVSSNAGAVLYWLIILLFLPAILDALKLEGLLDPVQNMVDQILGMMPNLIGAVVIGLVGWFVAKILNALVANLLAAIGFDGLAEKVGLPSDVRPSKVVGLVVAVFVFVPALIAALNTLQINAISVPATEMLSTFMAAIPGIFAAIVILTAAYFLGRFLSGLAASLLHGFGVDELPQRLGMEQISAGGFKLSDLAGTLVTIFVVLFAIVEASSQLGFEQVGELVTTLIEFAAQILLGSAILVVGLWLANIAYKGIVRSSGQNAELLANIARVAIIGLVLAMGLRAMGIADDIVNLGFSFVLGAVSVAIALAFGLGGREAAGRQMEYWFSRLRGGS